MVKYPGGRMDSFELEIEKTMGLVVVMVDCNIQQNETVV